MSPVTTDMTPWERLDQTARARLDFLGETIVGVARAGGPSVQWFRSLRGMQGAPSARQTPFLERLDRALHWEVGSSRRLLLDAADPSVGPEWVDDFEQQLVTRERLDESAAFGAAVTSMLRLMPDGERDEAMARIRDILGLPDLSSL